MNITDQAYYGTFNSDLVTVRIVDEHNDDPVFKTYDLEVVPVTKNREITFIWGASEYSVLHRDRVVKYGDSKQAWFVVHPCTDTDGCEKRKSHKGHCEMLGVVRDNA